jgi:hypothetical protein
MRDYNGRVGFVRTLRACGPSFDPVGQANDENQLRRVPFPPEIIQQAICLYLRFTLSFRDVEDL